MTIRFLTPIDLGCHEMSKSANWLQLKHNPTDWLLSLQNLASPLNFHQRFYELHSTVSLLLCKKNFNYEVPIDLTHHERHFLCSAEEAHLFHILYIRMILLAHYTVLIKTQLLGMVFLTSVILLWSKCVSVWLIYDTQLFFHLGTAD